MPRPYRERKKESAENVKARHERHAAKKRDERRLAEQQQRPSADDAVNLYRETRAKRMPVLAKRHARAIAAAKSVCDAAEARLHELRHAGRPKGKPRLLLDVRSNPDALIAAVSDWHGER
jgi:hypothetical protein